MAATTTYKGHTFVSKGTECARLYDLKNWKELDKHIAELDKTFLKMQGDPTQAILNLRMNLVQGLYASIGCGVFFMFDEDGNLADVDVGGMTTSEWFGHILQKAYQLDRKAPNYKERLIQVLGSHPKDTVGDAANRDYFNMWTAGSQSSPLATHILEAIRAMRMEDLSPEEQQRRRDLYVQHCSGQTQNKDA